MESANEAQSNESSIGVYKMLRMAQRQKDDYLFRPAGASALGRELQYAIDEAGHPILIVPLPKSVTGYNDKSCRGVTLSAHKNTSGEQILVVRCEESRFIEQFALLIDDIVEQVGRHAEAPLETVEATLETWRALFSDEPGAGLLSEAAQAGLFAELRILKTLASGAGPNALSLWGGPSGSRHDFSSKKVRLEVKATLTRNSFPVSIHGLAQLDDTGLDSLYLYAEQLEMAEDGQSVVDLAESILRLGVDRALFLTRLAKIGFDWNDLDAYRKFRFKSLDSRFYFVGDAFPKITPSVLGPSAHSSSLRGVQYQVELSSIDPSHSGDGARQAVIAAFEQ